MFRAISALVLACCAVLSVHAQSPKPIRHMVAQTHQIQAEFENIPIFSTSTQTHPSARSFAPQAQFLKIDQRWLRDVAHRSPQQLRITLPYHDQFLTLDLLRVQITTTDFSVVTSTSNGQPVPYEGGVHYQGILTGEEKSLVAISFFEDQLMGMITAPTLGNLSLGLLDETGNETEYVVYADHETTQPSPFACHADHDKPIAQQPPSTTGENAMLAGCVRVYMEADYELFQNKGSVSQTTDYITAFFNQVNALYRNEQVSIAISQIFVWETPDEFSVTSSSTVLSQFRGLRTTYNGDLAHLVGLGGNNLGGIAYVDVLCRRSVAYGYSDIHPTFSTVPTFSWTVEVVTHELGHNLGSPHTQSCTWPGGAIDNCVPTEGGCPPGPAPVNGGSIMSYCHLSSYGINFSNGFGKLPGDLVRQRTNAATCLTGECPTTPGGGGGGGGGGTTCAAPTNVQATSTGSGTARVTWTNSSGATAYIVRYRVVGATSFTTLNNATSPYTLTNLPANSDIEVAVGAQCGNTPSTFTAAPNFRTPTTGTTCAAPTNVQAVSTGSSTARVTWVSSTGATTYTVRYRVVGASAYTTVNNASSPYTLGNLPADSEIEVGVAAKCSNTTSSFTAAPNFRTPPNGPAPCNAPTDATASNITNTTAVIKWSSVTGVSNYTLRYRPANAASYTTLNNVTSPYTLTGLPADSDIEFGVSSKCAASASSFTNGSFRTAPNNNGGGNCIAPTGIAVSASANSANITWTPVPAATAYLVACKLTASGSWGPDATVTSPNHVITGLQPSTAYDVQIAAVCGPNNFAVSRTNFTTNATPGGGGTTCEAPTTLTSSPTPTTLTITWTAVTGAINYGIAYRKQGTQDWSTTTTVTQNTQTLSGLEPASAYEVRVHTICSASSTSSFTTQTFETSPRPTEGSCATPVNLRLVSIRRNNALIRWNMVTNAISYTLQIKRTAIPNWQTFIVGTTGVYAYNLRSNTTYAVRIATNCADGLMSSFTEPMEFITPDGLDAPTNQLETEPVTNITLSDQEDLLLSYPNPITDQLIVQWQGDAPVRLEMMDIYGRIIQHEPTTYRAQWAVSELPAGLYWVRAQHANETLAIRKVVKAP